MPDYASSATLTKIGKKMLVFPNYAKKSASTIEKSLADSRPMLTCAYHNHLLLASLCRGVQVNEFGSC